MLEKRLTRSVRDRRVAGVAGGIGEYLGIDSTLVRLGFIAATIFGGWGPVVYGVMWLVVPDVDDGEGLEKPKRSGDSASEAESYKVQIHMDGEE